MGVRKNGDLLLYTRGGITGKTLASVKSDMEIMIGTCVTSCCVKLKAPRNYQYSIMKGTPPTSIADLYLASEQY